MDPGVGVTVVEVPHRAQKVVKSYSQHIAHELHLQCQRLLRAFIATLLNAQVLLVSVVALASVYICEYVLHPVYLPGTKERDWVKSGVKYRVDMTFISVGAVFPLIFSIQAAFNRREAAARAMASMKAHCQMLYLLHRDWNRPTPGDLSLAGKNDSPDAMEARKLLCYFLKSVRMYLMTDHEHGYESYAEAKFAHASFWNTWFSMVFKSKVSFPDSLVGSKMHENHHLSECYDAINRLSVLNEKTLVRWGYTKSGEAPTATRLNVALTAIVENFEHMRNMKDYRTPVMLRYGNRVLVLIMAVFLGPYFNTFCYDSNLKARIPGAEDSCNVNYIVAELFVIVVTLLNQIAKDIEYPFDMEGMDDLFFELATDLKELAHLPVPASNDLDRLDSVKSA